MKKKAILWITGPIASGKDEVCKILKAKNFHIIDADKIGHVILNRKKRLLAKVFGKSILSNGKINRKILAKIVFSDKRRLSKLNSIVHPYIIRSIKKEINSLKASNIAINACLYKNLKKACPTASVVSILSSRDLRLKRLISKRNFSKDYAKSVINMQEKDSYYKKIADFVVFNDFTLTDLKKKVLEVLATIK